MPSDDTPLDRASSLLRRIFSPRGPRKSSKLGTFLGVYTPTVLTILGVIMYLRFGWVLGHMGLARTLAIVVLANLITLITTLSLSAVATNARVGVGGAYFMISRSLGLEIGGAIGLPLFLSQAFSVTLYAFGLAESFKIVWSGLPVAPSALIIVILVGGLAFRGAGAALKSQVPIMVLIGLSLVALTLGALTGSAGDAPRLAASVPSGEQTFWVVFSVFFPAVTGIMAGLGLSGDLEDPRKSLPRGTLLATLTGFAVYLTVPVLLAAGADPQTLRSDPMVWARIAPLGAVLILPGLWGAIFSSAVGSMLGAPRTLQALATDQIAPRRLAAVSRDRGEPVLGLYVSLAIAAGAVFLGDLNTVAIVVTLFFLTVYGAVNVVAALESLSGDPSWRPGIRVPWQVSALGGAACLGVMMLINPLASVVAVAVELGLWTALKRRETRANWGDVRRGVYVALIRWALLRLATRRESARNWRPHILVFAERMERRLDLIRFASWFSQNRGLVTVCELRIGDVIEATGDPEERRVEIEAMLRREGLVGFAEVDYVSSVEAGIVSVAQANGMAGIESNTAMLGWPEDADRLAIFLRVIRRLERLRKSLIIGRVQPGGAAHRTEPRAVDVWWGGLQRNGDLMLLLAYLLTRNPEWREARIRILSIASNELMKAQTEHFLDRLIPEIRIAADIEVMVKPEAVAVRELIQERSASADLVILGLATPPEGEEEQYARRLFELVEGLPSFFFVKNSSLFVGDLITGEEAPGLKVTLPRGEEPKE